jgi:hypothetical protein
VGLISRILDPLQKAGGMFTGSPPGELVQMLGMMTSGTAQATLLEGWIKGHAGAGGANSSPALDEGWVAQLQPRGSVPRRGS